MPLLLAVFVTLAVVSARRDSATFDEGFHIVSGLTCLERGDFRLSPENPPLARMWMALPLRLAGAQVNYASEWWRVGAHFELAFEFLYGPPNDEVRRDPDERLLPPRLAVIVLGVGLGLAVFFWTRELWGAGAGRVALLLYCFSPTILAHARLATTDLAAACAYVVTLWSFWRFLLRPGWTTAGAAGLVLGAALVTKLTTLLLVPTLAVLGLFRAALRPAGTRAEPRRRTGQILLIGLACHVCVWAVYGFRHSMSPGGSYRPDPRWPTVQTGIAARAIRLAAEWRLLPEAYVYGLSRQLAEAGRGSYLNGRIRESGTWYYFPEAFLLKSTPAELLVLAWFGLAGFRRLSRHSYRAWYLAVPVAFYGLVAVLFPLNAGHRHLLPIYPLLFILIGGAAARIGTRSARGRAALAVLLAAQVLSALTTGTRYLSYFNFLTGGPDDGWRYLSDSNLDWGQDLRRLREKMEEHRLPEVYLMYFGTGDPRAYGIRYRKVKMAFDFRPGEPEEVPPPGSVVAASIFLLQFEGYDVAALTAAAFDRAGDSILLYRVPAP